MVINPGGGWGCRSRGRLHTMHGTASGSETHLRQARERPSGNDPLGRAENSGMEAVDASYHKSIHRRSGAMSFHQVLLQHKGWMGQRRVCVLAGTVVSARGILAGGSGHPKTQAPSGTSSDLYASSRVSSEDRGGFCLSCQVSAHG